MSRTHAAPDNDLFASQQPERIPLADGAWLLPGFALPRADALLAAVETIGSQAPFRHMITPGGKPMSVAMSHAGTLGWVSDRRGYRYVDRDPQSGKPWPAMPEGFAALAKAAACKADFASFVPDACLINRYAVDSRMALHQDRDEADFSQPIVSVSLGLPVVFLFGGLVRTDRPQRVSLNHGDVLVWGGSSRLRFHGVMPLKPGHHPATGACRINLTFRRAG